jgi:hypothetical protein
VRRYFDEAFFLFDKKTLGEVKKAKDRVEDLEASVATVVRENT